MTIKRDDIIFIVLGALALIFIIFASGFLANIRNL